MGKTGIQMGRRKEEWEEHVKENMESEVNTGILAPSLYRARDAVVLRRVVSVHMCPLYRMQALP
ncbi:hypothetical protein PM082_005113 [Marasmius tenuissimus]|nr:hypothetical protein PM082_005113 [Marasmius tenuissimus]